MKINFYEEFPTEKNLEKIKLVKFPSKIFIAAKSVKHFEKLKKQAKRINKKLTYAYWPIVKNSYWISPFSNTEDLKKLFSDLNKIKDPLLIDLEPPFLNPKLFLKNISKLRKNKKIIKEFLKKNKNRVTTAQHPFPRSRLIKLLGLNYNVKTEKSLMYYTSANSPKINKYIIKLLKKIKNKEDYSIGLGTIAKGVITIKILSPSQLEEDIKSIKKLGFNKIIIFRLGGLNKNYMKVINKFI